MPQLLLTVCRTSTTSTTLDANGVAIETIQIPGTYIFWLGFKCTLISCKCSPTSQAFLKQIRLCFVPFNLFIFHIPIKSHVPLSSDS